MVTIKLERDRSLKLDINALADADQLAGERINEVLMGKSMGLAAIRALLWAGLKGEDPRLTPERTGQLIQDYLAAGGDLSTLTSAIFAAMAESGLAGRPQESGEKNGLAETQH